MDTTALQSKEPIMLSIEAFLRSLEGKNRSEATRQAYQTDLLQFFIWLKDSDLKAGDFGPEHITKGDVIEFLAACARRGLSGLSRARKLAAIREYYRYLVDHEIITKSPAAGVATPKREQNICQSSAVGTQPLSADLRSQRRQSCTIGYTSPGDVGQAPVVCSPPFCCPWAR